MDRKFEEELTDLKELILSMSAKVEQNIGDAIDGLLRSDFSVLEHVVRRDREIDRIELQVDEHCLYLLALHQPVARDLRMIATALKIVKDIERIGDMAKNIAQHGLKLAGEHRAVLPSHFSEMAKAAQTMLREALDAFVRRDVGLARHVVSADDQVDRLHKTNINELIQQMIQNPQLIFNLTHALAINKFLERIGDHSSNIGQMVVFMVEGKDIRHPKAVAGSNGSRKLKQSGARDMEQ